MQNKEDAVGKRFSFYQLLENDSIHIEIPTIQRDFAQGRENKSEVRDQFLLALYNYLREGISNRDLDFIYGSTELVGEVKKFIPLDGQQRLTTLFLLHWYLANISGNIDSFKELMFQGDIPRFNYLTRQSSSDFFRELLTNQLDFDNLLPSTQKKNNSLSKTIQDKGWFFLSWKYDPTIQSVLNMLDAIHRQFKNSPEFYDLLIRSENPIITFQYLDLEEFSLTEDLYIKMNSRGKPLTSFENFKARLEQHIDTLFDKNDKSFSIANSKMPASCREYFSFQIDTTWAKLFWNYKHLVGKQTTYDEELLNFIRIILANQYAIEHPQNISFFKDLIKNESATAEITQNISYYRFNSYGALTKDFITYLIETLDVLSNGNQKIKNQFTDFYYFNENEFFHEALRYNLSLPERAIFHAYLRYLIQHKEPYEHFQSWMRVIHNLVENSRIEEADHLISAIKSIESLLTHSDNILQYLVGKDCQIDFFASWQVKEEVIKANLILKSDQWKEEIYKFEKQIFHKGQLAYLLEFSGVWKYFLANKNLDWSKVEDEEFIQRFTEYANKSIALFSFRSKDPDHLIERALLTNGNYMIPASHGRLNFCSSKNVANYQRDYSWKRLLRFSTENIEDWEKRRMIVKDLLDNSSFGISKIEKSLKEIIKNKPEDWRFYFVDCKELIDYCQKGFISSREGQEIILYGATQINHYHIDMRLYYFYIKYISENENDYFPFDGLGYLDVKNSYDFSSVVSDFLYKRKYYKLSIYRFDGEFKIRFEKKKGKRDKSEINKEIVEIMESLKMNWKSDIKIFKKSIKDEKGTIRFFKKMCEALKNLSE